MSKIKSNMKKCIIWLSCLTMLLLCGCSKENSNTDKPSDSITWASLVKKHPFMGAFPEFDGDIENCQYRDISGMQTITFFDYKCEESTATKYYSSLAEAGFTNTEGTNIYRKKADGTTYAFTGGYSAGNFALNFSAE